MLRHNHQLELELHHCAGNRAVYADPNFNDLYAILCTRFAGQAVSKSERKRTHFGDRRHTYPVIKFLRPIRTLSDCRGVAALEFALVAPALLAMLLGIPMLGILFLAQAGLRSTVEDAARYATIWPRPSQSQIEARMTSRRFGMNPENIIAPTVTFNTSSTPNYVNITMGYNATINYVLGTKTIVLTETRRAYVTN